MKTREHNDTFHIIYTFLKNNWHFVKFFFQEHIELRMALSAAESKANTLNTQLKKLDEVQNRTEELLYQVRTWFPTVFL